MTPHQILFVEDDLLAGQQLCRELKSAVRQRKIANLDAELANPIRRGVAPADIVRAVVSREDIRLLIVDYAWEDSEGNDVSSLAAFEQAIVGQHRTAKVPLYLLTGFRLENPTLANLVNEWRNTVGEVFDVRGVLSKPISGDEILTLCENLGKAPDLIERIVSRLELPARVVDAAGVARTNNQFWAWPLNDPPPQSTEPGTEFDQPDPGGSESFNAYRLSVCKFDDGMRLDIAVPIPSTVQRGVPEYLGSLFKLLQHDGFIRLRFYRRIRVPDCAGILRLEHSYPDNGPIISRPIEGKIAEAFDRLTLPAMPTDLVYHIMREEDAKLLRGDTEARWWLRKVWAREAPKLVIVPVLCREPAADNGVFAAAVMVFDRGSQPSRSISKADVDRLKVSLRLYCDQIAAKLDEDRRIRRVLMIDQIHDFYLRCASLKGKDLLSNTVWQDFANSARELVLADYAAVAWCANALSFPRIEAVSAAPGIGAEEAAALVGQPVTEQNFPALDQCLKRRDAVYWPNWRSGEYYSGAAHSRFALPLEVGGQVIGAIGFVHHRPFEFVKSTVDAAHRLAEQLVAVLQITALHDDRRRWEISLVHEIRAAVTNMRKSIAQRVGEEPAADDELRNMQAQLEKIDDVIQAFVTINGRSIEPKNSTFDPGKVLISEVTKLEDLAAERRRRLTLDQACDPTTVVADLMIFSFVVRNLLRNAIKHGREGDVAITCRVGGGRWHLVIENLGEMSDEEDRFKFIPSARTAEPKTDGLHIGLAACKQWCDKYGATIDVRNSNKEGCRVVVATLNWPAIVSDPEHYKAVESPSDANPIP